MQLGFARPYRVSLGCWMVLLSETDWSAIQETLYLNSIPGMVDSIQQARKEGLDQDSETLDW
jgi:PHD/YefM family antitoxin component YafN of YafNO toxin-antitoxin module